MFSYFNTLFCCTAFTGLKNGPYITNKGQDKSYNNSHCFENRNDSVGWIEKFEN